MPKVSFVIPVYNAENTLRKCVESIIFGQEKDIELILIEDRSKDDSWKLCQTLADEFPQVKCLQNESNRGVSFTRNRGIFAASGQYLLFVDSDDWVSGDYAKALIDTAEDNPGKPALCGYLFLDYVADARRTYGIKGDTALRKIEKANFLDLAEDVLLQQLWNKLFVLQTIRDHKILFDESISMGEDFQFVIDYLKAVACTECVIINRPLYFYTRRSRNSLMSQWADISNLDKSIRRIEQMHEICGDEASAAVQKQIAALKYQFVYRIVRDRRLTKAAILDNIQSITHDADPKKYYTQSKKALVREKLITLRTHTISLWKRIRGRIQFSRNRQRVKNASRHLRAKELTIISQNCIGGVFYHDMKLPFQSPTVNAFIPQPDFIRFINQLDHYLQVPLDLSWDAEYPIGRLGDVSVHFVHYETCRDAADAWARRKTRIRFDKILVLCTDRDGFTDEVFDQWREIQYPKLLFTSNPKYAQDKDSVYFPEYKKDGCIPDIIPDRKFYKDGILLQRVNSIEETQA